MAIDLVCNMEVDETTTPFSSEYKGIRYYFCTALCRRVFNENPVKFIQKAHLSIQDPVCSMVIDPQSAMFTSTHQGTVYYFCSVLCKRRFDADPAAFASRT